jgi:2-phospho-L-lactate guanylyltransferase
MCAVSALWTLIPAKPFAQAKQRLSPVLSAEERAALCAQMLARTIATVRSVVGAQHIVVVSTDAGVARCARRAGADHVHAAPCQGLNAELSDAAARVPPNAPMLVLHADLPHLMADDVAAMLAADAPVVLAPDHLGRGTNALLHRHRERFFAFGIDSFAQHMQLARDRGLSVARIDRPGLAHDVDQPADWARLHADEPLFSV